MGHEDAADDRPEFAGRALLLPLALALLLVGVLVARWSSEVLTAPDPAGAASPSAEVAGVVTLAREASDALTHTIDVPWRPGDTVLDATRAAGERDPGAWRSVWRGAGAMAFMEQLGGVANQGAAGRNWLFSVNGERADRGAGAVRIESGDRILWSLAEYE